MGGTQTRCCASTNTNNCGGCGDKLHQLKLNGGDRQEYRPFDVDVTGCERLPGADDLKTSSWSRSEAAQDTDGQVGGSCGHCCADAALSGRPALSEWSKGQGAEFLVKSGSRTRGGSEIRIEDSSEPNLELLVDITKRQPGDDLGMKVLHRGVGVLVVAEIYPGGAVAASNCLNAKAGFDCLQVGDQIAVVNGIGSDDAAMAQECKRSQRLTLGVRRARGEGPV
mmetsp:Transcript_96287/g.206672  ORF Transcript_96287/g.206672 Transcript_96287/m.206672 type:complete len:224 (-) Transcript_96287:61-732(-)